MTAQYWTRAERERWERHYREEQDLSPPWNGLHTDIDRDELFRALATVDALERHLRNRINTCSCSHCPSKEESVAFLAALERP